MASPFLQFRVFILETTEQHGIKKERTKGESTPEAGI